MIENGDKIVFPHMKDENESSDDSSTLNNEHIEEGNNIAAKRIQRLCPGVDVSSLQNKGKLKNKGIV